MNCTPKVKQKTFGVFFMEKIRRKKLKHSYSDKVVELYKQGYGSTRISKLLHIGDTVVETWLRIYRAKGIMVFEKPTKQILRIDLKEQVVPDVL